MEITDTSKKAKWLCETSKLLLLVAFSIASGNPAYCSDELNKDKTSTSGSTAATPSDSITPQTTPAATRSDSSSSMPPANRNKESWDHGPSSTTPSASADRHAWPGETQSNSTSSIGGPPAGATAPTLGGMKPWPDSQSSSANAPSAVPVKPAAAPPPPGMEAALKLYSAKKWLLAQKSFEGFIKNGTADVKTHECLANCYYYQKIYSKALLQFDWIAKNAKNVTSQRSAENTARVLRCYRAGICPANCIKATDPRWHKLAGHGDELWMSFPGTTGGCSWSEHHIGQLITYVHGNPENMGTCPTCNGSGTVKVLKDGAPPPTQ